MISPNARPIAKLHSDGYWTQLEAWKPILNFHSIEVYAAPHGIVALTTLVLELADAVDRAAEDIGGSRDQLTILREAVKVAQSIADEPYISPMDNREARAIENQEAARLQAYLIEHHPAKRQPYPAGLFAWAQAALEGK
jgi:hypothetical protein